MELEQFTVEAKVFWVWVVVDYKTKNHSYLVNMKQFFLQQSFTIPTIHTVYLRSTVPCYVEP